MPVFLAAPVHLRFSDEDLYYTHYRLWELTKLEDLIRKEKDLQKSVAVDGVNQSVAQSYSFAKLWKHESIEKGNVVKQEKTVLSDDEDEEDEPLLKSDTEAHYECGFSSFGKVHVVTPAVGRKMSLNTKDFDNSGMHTGISTTKEVYGFDIEEPSESDMLKYVKYAEMCDCTVQAKQGLLTNQPKRLGDMSTSAISDYGRLKPTSFFTSDNAFMVHPLPVSKASMKIYVDSVECGRRGPKNPSRTDMQNYQNYAFEKRSGFAVQNLVY
ncbi:unnamed protein product [Gongylonema pulchrum]|uniref:Cilia- and flagella-associated protein 299 n=1 Tax=Gongylonema pulchrum TaxID=637853 RepID=A0A183CZD5_9BILA|nr:unnamed protein product [Gongylonema pulchrum]